MVTGEEGVIYHDGKDPTNTTRTTLAEWRSWAKGKRVFGKWINREKS